MSDEEHEPVEVSPPIPNAEYRAASYASESEDDTFKIIVRSANSKEVTLTVRPTTKCGAIVRAFLSKTGLADKYPDAMDFGVASPNKKRKTTAQGKVPQLCVEGGRIAASMEIGDQDVEDGDMVEVVGLD